MSPKEWLDLVLAQADGIRAKGILSLKCDGNEATFAALPLPVDSTPRPKPKDLLDDIDWAVPGGIPDIAPGKPTEDEDDEEPFWGQGSEGPQ